MKASEGARVWSNTRQVQYVRLPPQPPRVSSTTSLIARTCITCGELKMADDYRPAKRSKRGTPRSQCIACEQHQAKLRRWRTRTEPFRVAHWELLVARSCTSCGELLLRDSFSRGSQVCNVCSWARGTSDDAKNRAKANSRKKADASRRDAEGRRARLMWTGPEYEIAARPDLTPVQVATMLGRSIDAVRTMRLRMQDDPRKQAML